MAVDANESTDTGLAGIVVPWPSLAGVRTKWIMESTAVTVEAPLSATVDVAELESENVALALL